MDVRFVIVAPAAARKSFRVRLPVVVGRGDEAKFRIQQDSVSRQHCRFALDGAVVTVTDLGSTNGTHVAGTRIAAHAATTVSSGAEVQIGSTVLRVEYAATSHRKPAPAAAPLEADTVPLLDAAVAADEPDLELPEPEPPAELEPFGETTAAREAPAATNAAATVDEPALELPEPEPSTAGPSGFPDIEAAPAPTEAPAFSDLEPAPPPAEGSFDFFESAAAPPPAADGGLDDFFKSQS